MVVALACERSMYSGPFIRCGLASETKAGAATVSTSAPGAETVSGPTPSLYK